MPRRLLTRAPPSDAISSPARDRSSSTSLPEYQPPSFPLNGTGRRALDQLCHNPGTPSYETQLKDSTRHLGLCVGDLHERLAAQQDRLRNLRERRQEKGSDKTAEEVRLEQHLVGLERDVDQLTQESEESLRDVIDHRVELHDLIVVLGDLYTNAATAAVQTPKQSQRRARGRRTQAERGQSTPAADEEDQQNQPVPVVSVRDAYLAARAQKQAEYEALTHYERYALNNDYAAFKRIWHDAATVENGPPLLDASRWFRSDGRPVMSRPDASSNRRSTIGTGIDEDDDIAIAREVLSLNCPLSLRQMEEPYSNIKCKHTFEKSALTEYLSTRGTLQCPQSGCDQTFSKDRFSHEFFLDEAMLRRILRTKQNQRDLEVNMDDEDDDDDELDDKSLVIEHERRGADRVAKIERCGSVVGM